MGEPGADPGGGWGGGGGWGESGPGHPPNTHPDYSELFLTDGAS